MEISRRLQECSGPLTTVGNEQEDKVNLSPKALISVSMFIMRDNKSNHQQHVAPGHCLFVIVLVLNAKLTGFAGDVLEQSALGLCQLLS